MGDAATVTTTTTTITTGGNGIKRITPTQKTCVGVPQWVKVMIDIMQYQDCKIHSNTKDHKLDRFCINCVASFCSQSCSDHQEHDHIKIRRYVYNDVIKRPDFQKYFDCSGIQGYQTNKNKVLFLKRRKDSQHVKEQQQNMKDPCCNICNQSLLDASYCSIQCKVIYYTCHRFRLCFNPFFKLQL
ncbi:protein RGF1 INDUCIBLE TRANSCRIPTION FACTOR 1-like [Bidens hawaiensis]|uniref:protein RGF1 INDUCIBLE TRANSCRIPTION FACTOR 1-like n=1 Tax=Bidens hawaiensis TaxID=980011 RepID=UPI00404B0FB8